MAHTADNDAPQREHFDGCLTEHTWDEDDCNCHPGVCPTCGNALRDDGCCRWAPNRPIPPEVRQ